MSYRRPRFKVRLRAIFQSSLKYHPKKFLLKAAKALKVTPLPPPVPSRKEAIPTPVFGSAAVGFEPCVKFCPNEKLACELLKVFRWKSMPMKPIENVCDPWILVTSTA